MDKVAAKHEMRAAGIPTPDWVAFNATAFRELGAADTLEEIEDRLGFPLVVKPAQPGLLARASSSPTPARRSRPRWSRPSATTTACCSSATSTAASSPSAMLGAEPLPIVEAIPRDSDRFDFEARYEIGRTDYACPAELGEDEAAAVADGGACAPTRRSAARASRGST